MWSYLSEWSKYKPVVGFDDIRITLTIGVPTILLRNLTSFIMGLVLSTCFMVFNIIEIEINYPNGFSFGFDNRT